VISRRGVDSFSYKKVSNSHVEVRKIRKRSGELLGGSEGGISGEGRSRMTERPSKGVYPGIGKKGGGADPWKKAGDLERHGGSGSSLRKRRQIVGGKIQLRSRGTDRIADLQSFQGRKDEGEGSE